MINIKVDEAYAFDMLSVLDIKKKNSLTDKYNFDTMCNDIKNEVGPTLFEKIMNSSLYCEMVKVNKTIYDLIEVIRKGVIKLDATVMDDANTERFKIKRKLQSEFIFNELVENKTQI